MKLTGLYRENIFNKFLFYILKDVLSFERLLRISYKSNLKWNSSIQFIAKYAVKIFTSLCRFPRPRLDQKLSTVVISWLDRPTPQFPTMTYFLKKSTRSCGWCIISALILHMKRCKSLHTLSQFSWQTTSYINYSHQFRPSQLKSSISVKSFPSLFQLKEGSSIRTVSSHHPIS